MSAIGPELPPHLLAKRKRKQDEDSEDAHISASGANGSPADGEKRRRIVGPAMPPASINKRPLDAIELSRELEAESDDDDGFGPALPTNAADRPAGHNEDEEDVGRSSEMTASPAPRQLRRDDWMMRPPKQDDLAARMDPTKQRPRGFNTGKGARGTDPSSGDSSAWHETPEQKQKRLQDGMMGFSKSAALGPEDVRKNETLVTRDVDAAAIRQHTEKLRGPSLLDHHQKSKPAEAEDDPSKRAFDRERDMASGSRIGSAQRKEMLHRAAGFSSRFSSGSYL